MILFTKIIKEQQLSFDFIWSNDEIKEYLNNILKTFNGAYVYSVEKENIFIIFNDEKNRKTFIDTYNLILNNDYTTEDDEYDDSNPRLIKNKKFPKYFLTIKRKSFGKIKERN